MIHEETKNCLGREDLEHFKNISSAGQQQLEFSLRQEISGVISSLETGGIEMQKKFGHVENNLHELHRNLEHVKGAVDSNQVSLQSAVIKTQDSLEMIHEESKNCLGREDLEQFKNISSAGQKQLESFLHQEISGVVSSLETGGIEMQKKFGNVENNLHELHSNLEHVTDTVDSNQVSLQRIHKETKNCLGREDLVHFKNISSAGQQQLEYLLRHGLSGVISSLETGGIEMQKKFGHVEDNLHELHRNLEHVTGAMDSNQVSLQSAVNKTQGSLEMIHKETKNCLGREDLEQFKNISAGQKQLESFLRQEISGVISSLETGGIEMQKKFGHVEDNLHELHRNLEHVKGAVDSNQVSLQRKEEMESFLRQEITGVISLLETGQ
ncbi:uncharacterized protein LOC135206364 [Macrobrachium nipponense]|uniref:uncharacterized protein LOC135206364 n=1 Tax=Macrobrachium nipponense TaxID=159736 RepID=UPI0030C83C8F